MFLMFVQGGQSFIFSLPGSDMQKTMIVNAMGRKWEFTFTTLVTFRRSFLCLISPFLCHKLRRCLLGMDSNTVQLHNTGSGLRIQVKAG